MIHVRGTPAKSTPDGVYLKAGRTERALFCFTDATSNDGVCNGRACDENPIRAMMSASIPAKASRTKRVMDNSLKFLQVDARYSYWLDINGLTSNMVVPAKSASRTSRAFSCR